jgi:hypothetical protein
MEERLAKIYEMAEAAARGIVTFHLSDGKAVSTTVQESGRISCTDRRRVGCADWRCRGSVGRKGGRDDVEKHMRGRHRPTSLGSVSYTSEEETGGGDLKLNEYNFSIRNQDITPPRHQLSLPMQYKLTVLQDYKTTPSQNKCPSLTVFAI